MSRQRSAENRLRAPGPRSPIKESFSSRNGQNSRRCQIASPLAWKISDGVPAGWPANDSGGGWKLAARSARSPAACRTVSLTGQSHHRVGRITGQVLPGPVHPDQLERRVEPEDRLACQLPELIRLEWDEA